MAVSAGSGSVGYAISAASLVEQIQNINTANTYTFNYESGPLNGNFRIALSPTEAVGSNIPGFQPSDWAAIGSPSPAKRISRDSGKQVW